MGFVFPTVVARMRETVGRLAESGAGMSDCDFANACEPRAFAGGLQVWVGQDAPLYMTERIVRELRQLNVEPVFAMYGEDSSVLGFIPAIGG
jgi:hypothetical protein